MAIKSFNLDPETYKQFSDHCKSQGISMSKKIENFIRSELTKINPQKPITLKKSPLKTKEHPLSKYC